MRRFLLMTFVFCIGIIQSYAQNFDYTDENGVTWNCYASSGYNTSDGTWVNEPNVQINGASNYGDEVVVPSTIPYLGQNYTVMQMGSVFSENKTLKKVTLPKMIKKLPYHFFYNCSSLSSIGNTSQLVSIDWSTFEGCNSITELDLSACEVVSGLSSCKNLRKVILKACKRIENYAFSGLSSLHSVGDISNCTFIGNDAFGCCSSLKNVDLKNCTSIGDCAFQQCLALEDVDVSKCTSIGQNAFNECRKLTSIDLSSCKYLGESAFSNCSNLESVKNLNLITSISNSTFSCCSKLKSIDISNCTTIGSSAFNGCSNLSEVKGIEQFATIPDAAFSNTALGDLSLPNCTTIADNAFSSCPNIQKVDLPKCESLGNYAFRGCNNLSVLNAPMSQYIGMGAFGTCNSLNEVSLPETIKSLGYRCFDGNTLLTLYATEVPALEAKSNNYMGTGDTGMPGMNIDTLSLGKNVLIIVPEASLADYQKTEVWKLMSERIFPMGTQFDYDIEATAQSTTSGIQQAIPQEKLRSVVTLKVKGTINSYDIMIMRNKMDNLHYLDLSDVDVVANPYQYYTGYCTQDSVLGPHSFSGLSKLLTVKLPNSVKYIKAAFNDCDQLKSVTLPQKLVCLGDSLGDNWGIGGVGVFSNCQMLKEVIMPSCNVLGANSFYYCSSLKEIVLPQNLKRICSSAFYRSGLKNVVLPDSVESIGSYAFSNCYELTSVQFPPSLKTISRSAFNSCSQLENISLPSLTYIDENTFSNCSKLTEVRVPSTLERIGDNAFANCNNLSNVYTYTVLPINIDQNTFTNFKATTLYVPTQSYDNYYWNTQWSQFREIKEFNEPYEYFYLDNVFVLSKRFEGVPNIDVKDNGALKIVGSEKQNANLVTVKSDGTTGGSVIGNGNLDANELQFDITVNANQWYFLSFPFSIKFANIKAPGKYVIRKYDGAQRANNGYGGWVDLAADEDSLKQGVGYIFQTASSGEFILKVEKDQFGNMEAKDISTVLNTYAARNVQDASWNFVGNTQTSYMDVDALGYNAPITYWNGSSYEAVRPGDDELVLHPFQAFFVQKPTDVNSIEFKAEDRLTKEEATNNAKAARARRVEKGITPDRLLINLSVTDGKNIDNTRVVFNENKSQAYELDCDAAKFESVSDAPQLYSIEAQAGNLAINERPMGSVNLGFKTKKAGEFTFSAKRLDQPMLLQDNETGATIDLTDGDYQFTSDAGAFNSRFVLVPTRGTTGIADIVSKTGVNIMPTESGLNITGLNGKNVTIYSTNGTLLATRSSDGMLNLMAGVYIVKVDNMSTKVMVK